MDTIRTITRRVMRVLAVALNNISGGRITPNGVTIFALLMHLPIAYLIATQQPVAAAILLVVFGLFDTLDGELARLQKRVSTIGMVLDASTDRLKEVLLYCGCAYALIHSNQANFAVWAVAACGFSLSVSYVKAKGESALAEATAGSANERNKSLFRDGLVPFEVRIALLIAGLLVDALGWAVALIAILSAWTVLVRLRLVMAALAEKRPR